jgi:hypothetical protein
VGLRDHFKFLLGLGERDIEPGLPAPDPFEQELEGQRSLADSRRALDEIEAIGRKATFQEVVETFHSH